MSSDLAKTYDPASVEPEAYRVWLEEKCFHPDPAAPASRIASSFRRRM